MEPRKKSRPFLSTGTGKTYLSAIDMKRFLEKKQNGGRGLFIVHNLEILRQAQSSYEKVFGPDVTFGKLDGNVKEGLKESMILFASKDSLVSPKTIALFDSEEFDYIVIDEVHHSQAKSYKKIFEYFKPKFMLGMTATPDRNDRKDIMELFDYQKIAEFSFHDAIDEGFLVNIEYHGLTDDIDYSKIRYNNNRYDVQDLDRKLNIQSRNHAILDKYEEFIAGDKAIGFCVSIDHAYRMSELFNNEGVKSVSINSKESDAPKKIMDFKNNEYSVAFTVDMFNEGVDIPNVRGLMFLRPTESKTVFTQQLGRGLRLANGKEKVIVLDFIGNYRKANKIRDWLSKNTYREKDSNGQFTGKIFYDYGDSIDVNFDDEVEQIMNQEDADNTNFTKEDIIEEYYSIKDKLEGKRLNIEDWKEESVIPISCINSIFGSWHQFLEGINELTESSYHYPQGTSIGHLLYILKNLANNTRNNTLIDKEYVRFTGGLSKDKRTSTIQRQTKYKLQALMELGLVEDARITKNNNLKLTEVGEKLVKEFNGLFESCNVELKNHTSWTMAEPENYYNKAVFNYISSNEEARKIWTKILINFKAFEQLLHVYYIDQQTKNISKNTLYDTFFKSPYVLSYIKSNGIEIPSEEGSKRRVPFLNNLVESMGIIEISRSDIEVKKFTLYKDLFRTSNSDSDEIIRERMKLAKTPNESSNSEELETLKELFGSTFGTPSFYFTEKDVLVLEDV